jgi:hypothetical protein
VLRQFVECLAHATEFGYDTSPPFVALHDTWLAQPISEQEPAESSLGLLVRLGEIICWPHQRSLFFQSLSRRKTAF